MAEPVHVIPKHKHDYGMDSKGFPALTVDVPCRITFQTDDTAYLRASKGESADEIGWHTFNAVTGPVVIKGAEPGMLTTCSDDVDNVPDTTPWSVKP
jgi:acetamidase/formamidase